MSEKYTYHFNEEHIGERLDAAMAAVFKDVISRSQLKGLIKDGKVLVNGVAEKPKYSITEGDEVVFEYEKKESSDLEAQDIPIEVVYEDDDILVVNKQPGIVVHPGAGNPDGTLVNAVKYYTNNNLSKGGADYRPGIVHRLDKDTSGLIIIAKNDWIHTRLGRLFKKHDLKKIYNVIVRGVVQHNEGKCDAPIGRAKLSRKKMMVRHDDGKSALSEFKVVERFNKATLVDVRIHSGRTHQIRVHMAHLGFTVLGDSLYDGKPFSINIPRQCIHAAILEFVHPRTGELLKLSAPMPDDMKAVVEELRKQ